MAETAEKYTPQQIEEHCKAIAQIAIVSGLKKHAVSARMIRQLQGEVANKQFAVDVDVFETVLDEQSTGG